MIEISVIVSILVAPVLYAITMRRVRAMRLNEYYRGREAAHDHWEAELGMTLSAAKRCLDSLEDALINVETVRMMKTSAEQAQQFPKKANDKHLEGALRNRESAANRDALAKLADNSIEGTFTPACGPTFRRRLKIIGDTSYANIWTTQTPHNTSEEQAETLRMGGALPGKPTTVDCLAADPRFATAGHIEGCEHMERENTTDVGGISCAPAGDSATGGEKVSE